MKYEPIVAFITRQESHSLTWRLHEACLSWQLTVHRIVKTSCPESPILLQDRPGVMTFHSPGTQLDPAQADGQVRLPPMCPHTVVNYQKLSVIRQ